MPVKTYETKSAIFHVHKSYVIAEPKDRTDVSEREVKQLAEIAQEHFQGDFGLIENRKNQSSIDPRVYTFAKGLMPNLVAFTLVARSDINIYSFHIESFFTEAENIQSKLFQSIEDAEHWMERIL